MSDKEAGDLYDRSIRQGVKNFGSYYSRAKRNIKREKMESTDDGSSWIVDDNINYDSDSDEKHDEEDKRSS